MLCSTSRTNAVGTNSPSSGRYGTAAVSNTGRSGKRLGIRVTPSDRTNGGKVVETEVPGQRRSVAAGNMVEEPTYGKSQRTCRWARRRVSEEEKPLLHYMVTPRVRGRELPASTRSEPTKVPPDPGCSGNDDHGPATARSRRQSLTASASRTSSGRSSSTAGPSWRHLRSRTNRQRPDVDLSFPVRRARHSDPSTTAPLQSSTRMQAVEEPARKSSFVEPERDNSRSLETAR